MSLNKVCDMCGYEQPYRPYPEEDYRAAWGTLGKRDACDQYDLCPECYEKVASMVRRWAE